MASHNQQVEAALRKMESILNGATCHQDVYDALDVAIKGPKPFQFDYSFLKGLRLFGGIMVLGFFLAMVERDLIPLAVFMTILGIATFIFTSMALSGKSRRFDKVSEKIIGVDAFLDNNINPQALGDGWATENRERFAEFSMGNYSRRILAEYESTEESELDFQYYIFEYVNKTVESSRNSDGETTTKTVYKTNYRSGFIFQFPYAKSISVNSGISWSRRVSYKPASIDFNRAYHLDARDEQALAKFLKPKVVELFNELNNVLSRPSLVILEDNLACLSFSDQDVLPGMLGVIDRRSGTSTETKINRWLDRKFNNRMNGLKADDSLDGIPHLSSPKALLEALKGHTSLNKFGKVCHFVQELKRYSDNNFD